MIWRENGLQDIIRMALEDSTVGAFCKVPESDGLVTRARQKAFVVRGEGEALDKVVVALEGHRRNTSDRLVLQVNGPDSDCPLGL